MSKQPTQKTITSKIRYHSIGNIPIEILEKVINKHRDQLNSDHEEFIINSIRFLEDVLLRARENFPNASIKEWYLMMLACFSKKNYDPIKHMLDTTTKTWSEYRNRYPGKDYPEIKFAEEVMEGVKI